MNENGKSLNEIEVKPKKDLSSVGCFLFAAFCICWFLLPLGCDSYPLTNNDQINAQIEIFYPFSLPFSTNKSEYVHLLTLSLFSVYLVPFAAVFFIAAGFLKPLRKKKILFLLAEITVTIMLYCCISCFLNFANTSKWFLQFPTAAIFTNIVAAMIHIALNICKIQNIKKNNNPEYQGYQNFKMLYNAALKKECPKLQNSDNTKHNSNISDQRKSKTKNKRLCRRTYLRTKVLVSFLCIISFSLFLLGFGLLYCYRQLLMESIGDTGRTHAAQTANIFYSSRGNEQLLFKFFEFSKQANEKTNFPFKRIDVFYEDSSLIYTRNISDKTIFPEYPLAYSTVEISSIDTEETVISSKNARKYFDYYASGNINPILKKNNNTNKYIWPIIIPEINRGNRLVGFSVVTYNKDILMRPYFQTITTTITLLIILLYFSVILIFLVADHIMIPLLILQMNVRNVSELLAKMLSSKNTKIVPENLVFKNLIKTNDEIKDLSNEIDNMISIIRRIIPYISVSTLQNAKNDSENAKTTTRELTFLFVDIRDFTALCEKLNPKDVVSILNHYLNLEAKIILNNNGDIDKFVGDEMMAFFSGPKKEQNACNAAIQICEAIERESKKSLKEGKPVISLGIGISSGKVIFGSVGAKTRMDFTSIGDTVNLGARLEGANKIYQSKSIISETVYNHLNDTFICRELDFITVKGKEKPVRIYEIMQKKNKPTNEITMIKEKFENGLTYYRKQQWDNAEHFFKICVDQYNDKPSRVFIERIEYFRQNPPSPDWNGVFRMTMK